MSSPTIAACAIIEKTKVSRRVRYSPSLSPDSTEKIFGPGPGDPAVMARSCPRGVVNSQHAVRRSSAQKGFPEQESSAGILPAVAGASRPRACEGKLPSRQPAELALSEVEGMPALRNVLT